MFESITTRLEVERQVRRYLGIALRRWRWLVLGVGLGLVIGGYRYLKAPRIYQATSQVLLSLDASDHGSAYRIGIESDERTLDQS